MTIWARNEKKRRFSELIFLGMRQCFDPEELEDEEWDWPEAERL